MTAITAALAGIAVGYYLHRQGNTLRIQEADRMAKRTIETAEQEAENKRREAQLEGQSLILQARADMEKEIRERRAELTNLDRRIGQREEQMDRRSGQLDRRESELSRLDRDLAGREKVIREKEEQLDAGLREQRHRLEQLSSLTSEEAKRQLMGSMEQEARFEVSKMAKRLEEEARETAERQSKEIMVTAMQRLARDYISEATISVLNLPNEGMKGRIIGREGRNIRALESATGIDLIIDETPDAVIISGFDPYRREVAKIALERLIADGRIHPARIEETVEKVRKELDKLMREEAERVIFDVGLQDIHPELVKVLGRLKYRTSYGQNNLAHAREAAFIAGIMASELNLDVKLIKRAALLHDIGKAVSQEEEGSHAILGADLVKRYGEGPKIVNAVAAHHGEVEANCIEAVLVSAAESLSAARPGARRESVESYVKRLEKLEQLATSFKGVEKAYAIQAGREIRVIVKQSEVSDAESAMISREVAKKVEQELSYPGQIKVTVIRENRYIEYAR